MEEHHYHLLTENKFSLNEITEEDDENEKMWNGFVRFNVKSKVWLGPFSEKLDQSLSSIYLANAFLNRKN
jgi:hypothetical protein